MKNSMLYRIFIGLANIYMNSKTAIVFSDMLSKLFVSLINSKTFKLLKGPSYMKLYKNSLVLNIISKLYKVISTFNKEYIKDIITHSFFANLFLSIFEKKEKEKVNIIFLILFLTLIFNMLFKMILGQFSIIANKKLIILAMGLIVIYLLKIDYWTILKNSKFINISSKVLKDEPFNN